MIEHKYLDIELIEILENNPRTIEESSLKKLCLDIEADPTFLEQRPSLINFKDGKYICYAGQQRIKAQKLLGRKTAPVFIENDVPEDVQNRRMVIDNTHRGEWDMKMLVDGFNFSMDELKDFGFSLPEINAGFAELSADFNKAEDDGFEIPEEIETDIKVGDVFRIGPHILVCGDSTIESTYHMLMAGSLADLVVTDPPYNVNYEGGTKDALTIMNDSMSDQEFYSFLFNFYSSLAPFVKEGAAWYVWHADSEGANFRLAMKKAGIEVKQCLIWVKNSMVMGRQDYQWKHEPCLYGWKPGAAHNWYSDRKQTTILEFDKPIRNAEDPTMKPVELISYQVKNSSKVGDVVVDSFGGSGNTMVVCHQMKRIARLIEFDPKYCQVIIDRMLKLDPTLEVEKIAAFE